MWYPIETIDAVPYTFRLVALDSYDVSLLPPNLFALAGEGDLLYFYCVSVGTPW